MQSIRILICFAFIFQVMFTFLFQINEMKWNENKITFSTTVIYDNQAMTGDFLWNVFYVW